MRQYQEALKRIMSEGVDREGRNGLTRALFGIQLRFNMHDGFPAVTTKKLAFKAVKSELLWFIEGSNDDNRLKTLNGTERTIWTENVEADYWRGRAKFSGDLGRVYGVQWRRWQKPGGGEVDQLAAVIEKINTTPNDRRLIVSAWNPGELDQMALPPCHMMFQLFPANGKLSLHMIQRSCDMFLGVPFNIASYALMLHMIAHVTDHEPYEFIVTLNDAHVYHEHFDAVREQLTREPLALPALRLNPDIKNIDSFTMDDIKLEGYKHHPPIRAKMIV